MRRIDGLRAGLGGMVLVCAAAAAWALGPAPPRQAFSAAGDRTAIVRVMTAVADWQLANPSQHEPYDWTQAAFYTGMMAFAGIIDNPTYVGAMKEMGERNQWRPGLRPGHADDYAVVATYAQLFQREKNKAMLGPSLALFNFLLTRRFDDPLVWGGGRKVFWSRGNGWVIAGLARLLQDMPPDFRGRDRYEALVRALRPDGMLGWVQQIGAEPGTATFESTEVYGTGAFLLAGSAVHALAK